MSDEEERSVGGPLDVATLEVLGGRAVSHPLVDEWQFRPDALSPRRLELRLDADQFPNDVSAVRLDVRWFDGDDYSVHYLEVRGQDAWQCRWDRHPKPDVPTAHVHPPPNAASAVEPSDVDASHPLGVLFSVLDWIADRVRQLHDE